MTTNIGLTMIIKKNSLIPNDDHIIRYVPWNKLRKNADDGVIGVLGEAFKPRPSDNEGLSATWIECFKDAGHKDKIFSAIRALRNSKLKVTPKSGFAIGKVGNIKSTCLNYKNLVVDVVYKPSIYNEAHVEVRRLPQEDLELHELLAEYAWSELILNSEVP